MNLLQTEKESFTLWTVFPTQQQQVNGHFRYTCNLFARPSEQWGWVHEMILGEDFDKLPWVIKAVFRHYLGASCELFERFNKGNALFPPDPLGDLA